MYPESEREIDEKIFSYRSIGQFVALVETMNVQQVLSHSQLRTTLYDDRYERTRSTQESQHGLSVPLADAIDQ
jgi:hypothetical protein